MKTLLNPSLLLLLSFFFVINAKASDISDSSIKVIIARFEKFKYKLDKNIKPQITEAGNELPRGDAFPCYTGKEIMVVAVFNEKPADLAGRMLVSKKYNGKVEYDKHMFEDVGYDAETDLYYSFINVLFPKESNNLNCMTTLQIQDKKGIAKDIRLLIFIKQV